MFKYLSYKVTDKQGATTQKTINVTVNPKMLVINAAPKITATDKVLTVGDKFNELDGVTATDKEDGKLTDKVVVVENTVDMTKAGPLFSLKYNLPFCYYLSDVKAAYNDDLGKIKFSIRYPIISTYNNNLHNNKGITYSKAQEFVITGFKSNPTSNDTDNIITVTDANGAKLVASTLINKEEILDLI